jgi:ketosteroid isomerase-like protein
MSRLAPGSDADACRQDFPTRIDGKDLNMKLYEAMAEGGGAMLAGEMANAKVQLYGDVAILTYNFIGVGRDDDGETYPNLAKSTRIYAKIDGDWKLVHANFAPVHMDDD